MKKEKPMMKSVEKPEIAESMDKYAIKDAARVLMEASEIKMDKELYKKAMELVSKKHKAISSMEDLKNLRDSMNEDAEDED